MDSGAPAFIGAFEERNIASIDGLNLYVRDYAPMLPVTGLPVIMLHGLTRNARDFEIVAPRIASLGRRVIVADMRGRGRSAYDPDPAHYVPAVYAQDVMRIQDVLDIPYAVFVGTSMGGIITMVIAALAPNRIAAAVLNDVGPILDQQGLTNIAAFVGRSQPVATWDAAAEAVRAVNGRAFPNKLDDTTFWLAYAHRTWAQRDDGQIHADYDPNIALAFTDPETSSPIDMTPLFEGLKSKPVLSLRGAVSDLLSAEGVAHMRNVKSDIVTAEVAQVGHAPLLDEEDAWLALLDFLAVVP